MDFVRFLSAYSVRANLLNAVNGIPIEKSGYNYLPTRWVAITFLALFVISTGESTQSSLLFVVAVIIATYFSDSLWPGYQV